jgi:DNA mismatch repair protein MutS
MITIFYSIVIFVSFFISHAEANTSVHEIQEKISLSLEQQVPNSTLQKLAAINMQTFSWQEPWWEEPSFEKFIEHTLADIINPCAKRKRLLAFDFFQETEQTKNIVPNVLGDDLSTWHDLSLFKGDSNKETYLASIIDRTSSELGKISLFQLLANPISHVQTLLERQQVISTILNNDDLFGNLNRLLGSLAQSESVVLSWWNKDPLKQSTRRCYYEALLGKPLNEYTPALDGLSVYDRSMELIVGTKTGFASIVLISYGILQLINANTPHELATQADQSKKAGGWLVGKVWKYDNNLIRGLTAIITGIICGTCSFDYFKKFRSHILLENGLHGLMAHAAQVVNVMHELKNIITENPALRNCQELTCLSLFFDTLKRQTPAIQEFIELLSSDELQSQPSTFWLHGNTLRAYRLINQIKDDLAPGLTCVGKLDAFLSLAKLCKESSDKKARFSLVEFIQDSKPVLTLSDVWHPFISTDKVIPHAVTLGGRSPARNAVITGPDNGGKSTVLKEVTFAVLMAQSCGIAPASSMQLTPFHNIVTHLSPSNNKILGTSQLKTPDEQADNFVKSLEAKGPEIFHFFAFDKVLSTGSPVIGEEATCSLARKLEQSKNCISLMTTHFAHVTQLAEQSKSFQNFQLPAYIKPNGRKRFSYNLEPGISHQDIALITPQRT